MNDETPKPPKEPMTLAQFAAKASEDARGIVCPQCGRREWKVVYKRPYPGGREQRRRACLACGHRVTTIEKVIG